MITFFIFCSIIFLIYVFFYKQSISDYTLLQLEFSQIEKLQELLLDNAPVIIKNCEIPHCVKKESLLSVPRFTNIFLGSCRLGDYLEKKKCELQIPNELQIFLANETGLQSYINHNWLPKLHTNPLSQYISSIESKLSFGSYQLQKTTAIWSIILPIESRYICSLVNPKYSEALPPRWKALQDLESVKNLNYIDVIVKPGTMLLLPAHWYFLLKAEETGGYFTYIEYHQPVSMLNSYLEKKV